MTAFEDYVSLELPQRPVLIKGPAEATGDPNLSALPKVTGAPIGSLYLQDDVSPKIPWIRLDTGSTTWEPISSTSVIPPTRFRYVDQTYTGSLSTGSETYPFTSIQAALTDIGVPTSVADANEIYTIEIYGDDSITYFESPNIPANRKVNLIANGYVRLIGTITVTIDGNEPLPSTRTFSLISRYQLDINNNNISTFVIIGSLTVTIANSPPLAAIYLNIVGMALVSGAFNVSAYNSIVQALIYDSLIAGNVVGASNLYLSLYETSFSGLAYSMTCFNLYIEGFHSELSCPSITVGNTAVIRNNIFNGATAITATTSIRFAYTSWIEYASVGGTVTTPTFDIENPPQPPTKCRYVDENAPTGFENGSEEFPYTDLLTAFADITSSGFLIFMLSDYTATAQILIPAYEFTIIGNNYLLERNTGANLFLTQTNSQMTLFNCQIRGNLVMQSNNAFIKAFNSLLVSGRISLIGNVTGSMLLKDCRITSFNAGVPAIRFTSSNNSVCDIINCEIKGGSGAEALRWESANSNVTIRRSTIVHGSGGANNPFTSTVGAITYDMTLTELNSDPDLSVNFTNNVATPYNVFDAAVDF